MLHDENETHEFGALAAAVDKARDWPPELVILGESFIAVRGLEAIGAVRGALPKAKVLVVGKSADSPVLKGAGAAGAAGVLAGPITVEGVRRKVDALLGRGGVAVVQLAPLSRKP
jgi:DNA-binding NarL/FixJ family response regulator